MHTSLRLGDPLLDPVLKPLGTAGFRLGVQLASAPLNGDAVPPGLPPEVAALVAATAALPTGADPVRLARAAAFGERHLSYLVTALFCSSLPRLFLGAKGALVLRATGRMEAEHDERINETGRFVLDVWRPDAMRPEGRGLRSAVRVRVLHGAVRAHLSSLPQFPATPINQAELLGTLLAFSVAAVDGVRQLGVPVHPGDEEDVWHLWRTVGTVLGIEPAVLPDSVSEARRVLDALEAAHAARSPGGEALARVLLSRMEAHLPFAPELPRRLWTRMLGDWRMRMLGFEPGAPLTAWELAAVRAVGGRVGASMLELGVQLKLGGRVPTFAANAPGAPRA